MNLNFKHIIGVALLILGCIGVVSLCMKEFPLALYGQHSIGRVRRVETIRTSTGSAGSTRSGARVGNKPRSNLTYMHVAYTTQDGRAMEVKILATFNTEAKEGDEHPLIYLPSKPETAKIYSVKQLWLPMGVGVLFSTLFLAGGWFLVRGKR
jgi:hypothetical protein